MQLQRVKMASNSDGLREYSMWFQRLMSQISANPALGHLCFSVVSNDSRPLAIKWPRWRRLSTGAHARATRATRAS